MTFIPTLPSSFLSVNDPTLKLFLEKVVDSQKVKSFVKKAKVALSSPRHLQRFQDRHYLELAVINLLGKPESRALFKIPNKQLIVDSVFEAAEFLSVFKAVYEQTPRDLRKNIRGAFNSGFDSHNGMLPLAHEMHVAHALFTRGFEVEFVEYGGSGRYDFSVRKGELEAQIDCKLCSGDNGKSFKLFQTDVIYDRLVNRLKKHEEVFHGKMLILYLQDRSSPPRDIPSVCVQVVDELISGKMTSVKEGLVGELINFNEDLENKIISCTDAPNESDVSSRAMLEAYNQQREGEDLYLEWLFIPQKCSLKNARFALLFCSIEEINWKKTSRKVVRDSLSGQLRGAQTPIIFQRYCDLSDQDVLETWFHDTSIDDRFLNPFDELFNQIITTSTGQNLCAMYFIHRPVFKESSLLGPKGNRQTLGQYPVRSIYNKSHPSAADFKRIMGW